MRPDELTPEEHRVLERGRFVMTSMTNVAPGCVGSAVRGLEARGMMQRVGPAYVAAVTSKGGVAQLSYDYEVTRAGRDAYVSYGPPYVPVTL